MAASQAREALAAAAGGRSGHEPWLFYPRDGRWRWWSFKRGWTEVERWQAVLARGEGPAVDTAPAPETSPEALCHYLAASAGLPRAPTACFDRLLAPPGGSREIVVVAPPAAAANPAPTDRLARSWLDWCCAHLAVLALEPSRPALVGSVLWCRPTALLVDAEQERALAEAVAARSSGRVRRAAGLLDRLRVLLVAAADLDAAVEHPAPAASGCEWRAWGVERRLVGCPEP